MYDFCPFVDEILSRKFSNVAFYSWLSFCCIWKNAKNK